VTAPRPAPRHLLEQQWKARERDYVSHNEHARNDSGRIMTEGSFYTAWRAACRKAGLAGRTFHDLRRTAAMNFSVRGFDREEIMALCGWKNRCNVHAVQHRELRAAVEARPAAYPGDQWQPTGNLRGYRCPSWAAKLRRRNVGEVAEWLKAAVC
jgi:integrase